MSIKALSSGKSSVPTPAPDDLLTELRSMIDCARESIASTVNARLTTLYWQLGNRIRKEILKDE